jgi:hypothetical protein
MPVIIEFVEPAKAKSARSAEKQSVCMDRTRIRLSPASESEQRSWKPSPQAASSKAAIIELFVFVLFLVVALIAIGSCFAELSYLLESDAIEHLTIGAVN